MARRLVIAAIAACGLLLAGILGTSAIVIASLGSIRVSAPEGPVEGIPPEYLALYREAAAAAGIDWAVLAAIGRIESDHGRLRAPGVRSGSNFCGAAGPMQFGIVGEGGVVAPSCPSPGGAGDTWGRWGTDGDGDGRRDVYDPADAIPAAAALLVASGAPADYRRALLAYNHSEDYVRSVLTQAAAYRAAAQPSGGPIAGAGRIVFPVAGPASFSDSYRSGRAAGGHCPDHPGWHCAIDIFAARGTPIVSPIAGRAGRVGWNTLGGNRVWVEGEGESFYLAHLDRVAPGIVEGSPIAAGQRLGDLGDTGSARGTPPHLHVAWFRTGPDGVDRPADPYPLLRRARP